MTRPNILILLPDQLRADFLGCYGAKSPKTPNIDRLAAHGDTFEQAISPFPLCVPARAAMLTGRSAFETGVIDNDKWLRPDRREAGIESWPEILGRAGYHTAAIGKMHFYPWDIDEGFAERRIAEDKRHITLEDDYAQALKARGLRRQHGHELQGYAETKGAGIAGLPEDLFVDRWVAEEACAFIGRQGGDQPFAAFVGFPSPHCPYDPTEEALEALDAAGLLPPIEETEDSKQLRQWMIKGYSQSWAALDLKELNDTQIDAIRRHYAALIEMLDAEIGKVLDALAASPHADNTVVIFASDHGDFVGDFRMLGKSLFYEPSVHVPLIMADMRQPPAPRRRAEPVALQDLFPTLLDLAGCPPEPRPFYRSLREPGDPERAIAGITSHGVMLRQGRFKLTRYVNGVCQAFDLDADPQERNNLFDDPAVRPRIDAADRKLTAMMLEAMIRGQADKDIAAARAADKDGFAQRGWQRPWPAPAP